MPEYSNITNSKKFLRVLTKLKNKFSVEISGGGRHPLKVTSIYTNETYPIPCGHREINIHIVKEFVSWLIKNKVCSKKEFNGLI